MNKGIEQLRNSIAHYEENGPYTETDLTLDDLCETLVRCEEIYESITIPEMNALWYMRHINEPYANQSYAYLLVGRMRERYEAAEARRRALREGRVSPVPPEGEPRKPEKSYYETYLSNIENPLKERLQELAAYLEGRADGLELALGEKEVSGIGPIIALLRATVKLITEKSEDIEE